jgi:hypothetical protein
MSGEVSYFSRFFVKFVEIIAAGLASAISAYLLAHFGGLLLSSPTPASAPAQTAVQVAPTAGEVAESLRAHPTVPVTAAADAPVAQPAQKAGKDAKALPPRKHTKTDTSVAEKEPRGQKSAEALARARAALANVDANRPAPADALMGPGLTDTRSAPVDVQPRQAAVPSPQADVVPRPVDVPPRAAAINAAPHATYVQPQPVLPRPATGADLQPRSPDVRTTVDSLPPSASPPLEIAAPRPPPAADQDKGVFSAVERIPDLLRPNPPPATGEIPRPPMPIGTAPPE